MIQRILFGLALGVGLTVACGEAGDTAGAAAETLSEAWGEEEFDCPNGGTNTFPLGFDPLLYRVDQCGQGLCVPDDGAISYDGLGTWHGTCRGTTVRIRWLDPR